VVCRTYARCQRTFDNSDVVKILLPAGQARVHRVALNPLRNTLRCAHYLYRATYVDTRARVCMRADRSGLNIPCNLNFKIDKSLGTDPENRTCLGNRSACFHLAGASRANCMNIFFGSSQKAKNANVDLRIDWTCLKIVCPASKRRIHADNPKLSRCWMSRNGNVSLKFCGIIFHVNSTLSN